MADSLYVGFWHETVSMHARTITFANDWELL